VELIGKKLNSVDLKSHKPWLFLASAVSDYFIPKATMEEHKIQAASCDDGLKVELTSTPKMLGLWRDATKNVGMISFKLETDFNIMESKINGSFEKYGSNMIIGNLLETRYDEVILCNKIGDGKGGKGKGWSMEKVVLKENPGVENIEELIVDNIVGQLDKI